MSGPRAHRPTRDYLNGDDAEHKLCIREAQSGQMRGQSAAIRAHVNGTLTDVTTNGIDNLHTSPMLITMRVCVVCDMEH